MGGFQGLVALLGVSAYLTLRFATRLRAKEQEAASLLVEVVRLQEQLSFLRDHPSDAKSLGLGGALSHGGARGLNMGYGGTRVF